MDSYLSVMKSVLDGVPWSPEKAEAAGFPSVYGARDRVLGSAHFLDTEEQWHEPEARFEEALEEIRQAWGEPDFHGCGDANLRWENALQDIERLAYWQRGECIAYIKLELCDNTRIRHLVLGERALRELTRP